MCHQYGVYRDAIEASERRYGLAAAVHERGGDQQTNILTLVIESPGQAKKFSLDGKIDALRRSNTLYKKSPCVMPGLFVFGAWISQANDQLYGSHDRGSSLAL
jgi:hypothetical protein